MHGSGEARDMSLNTGPYKEMIRATVQLEASKFPNSETYFNPINVFHMEMLQINKRWRGENFILQTTTND